MSPGTLDAMPLARKASLGVANAAWHSLLWLTVANVIGVLIAVLLLFPVLNKVLGEWTYGRWVIVHMNLELYGWSSLPLVGFLFNAYGADRESMSKWCRPVLWVWSAAMVVGVCSWLSGQSSGKLFLDWSGYARVFFPIAILVLWLFIAIAFAQGPRGKAAYATFAVQGVKLLGLVLLFVVPFLIYIASSPAFYPAINPDTGGPTGASQLESSLIVVAILLMLPYGLTQRKPGSSWMIFTAWVIMIAEFILCIALGRADISHHSPMQYISLGSLLAWLPLTPAYYARFEWHAATRLWRVAFLAWWSALVLTGWVLFLPGVLDHFKFTDGLVGHSFVAMAGFTSSLLIFMMVQLMGDDGWIFNGARSFYLWNGSVISYVVLMTIAGWREGLDPTFTIVPGMARNLIYGLRLITGILMFFASLEWFLDATALLRERGHVSSPDHFAQETTA